jgi:hypothetical protein
MRKQLATYVDQRQKIELEHECSKLGMSPAECLRRLTLWWLNERLAGRRTFIDSPVDPPESQPHGS